MTSAHLAFALMTTIYILTAIQWEEKHGKAYQEYRRHVPMLIPRFFKKGPKIQESQPVRLSA
jgi:protein-S-isoprenylcysteine O-methyltransferase Ste14